MIKHIKTIEDDSGIVFKLLFEDDGAIAEAVVYRYGCRGVICFSVQSGCKVGCSFCGTGKKFIRDFSCEEMFIQIKEGLKLLNGYDKIQIMSMSMGEPMDNMYEISNLIPRLLEEIPKHDFFLSTVGLRDKRSILQLVNLFKYDHFGLQFSLHNPYDIKRKKLLGNYDKLLNVQELRSIANVFKSVTGKRAYFNYIVSGNESYKDMEKIVRIVDGHHLTCSVLCSTKKLIKGNQTIADNFMAKISDLSSLIDIEFSTFNPAGQDTIGGGCGQLLYVQKKLKNYKGEIK
ncbi:MAG: radical SAM protein [Novosphingobium sp.]|nr:radical SAM protein [Novosphingobium sp.]